MDIFTIRQLLRTTRLSDIPLRVTFYARVSTDSDEQIGRASCRERVSSPV